MKKFNSSFNSAFTLVELMVVLAIIVILTGIGAVSLNNFNNNQRLEGAKGELAADLKLARNMAITNQIPNGSSGSLDYVSITINNGIVDSSAEMGGESNSYFSKSNQVVNTINSSFGFAIETGKLTNGSGVLSSSDLCLILYLTNDEDDKRYLEINSSGLIYEEENEVDCG